MIKARVTGVADIIDDFQHFGQLFDLDKGDLGVKLLAAATLGIMEQMDRECDPEGVPWPALSPSYLEFKAQIAPMAPMGVLYGIMKTWEQVAGERHIEAEFATMTYGTSPIARVEAVKFQEGGVVTGTNQPPRPFYALTMYATNWIATFLDDAFRNAW